MKCGVKKRHADVTAIKDNMLIEIHEVGRLRKKNGQPVRRELRVIDDIINSKEFDGAHIYYHDRYSDMKLKVHHFYVTQEDAGLNIYAGTLTRYYAENWERAGKPAGEYVYTLKRVEEEENKEEILDEKEYVAKIQEDVEAWQDSFLKALNKVSQKCYSPWQEDNEKPYFAKWLEREAFGAMLLVAACHSYGEPVPETVSKGWKFVEHPLIERLSQDEEDVWSLFKNVTRWVPLPDCFMIAVPLPNGERAAIGTVAGLRKELEWLNDMVWQEDEDTICRWSERESFLTDSEPGYNTQSLAKYAFSIFFQAARYAEENQVSVVIDI